MRMLISLNGIQLPVALEVRLDMAANVVRAFSAAASTFAQSFALKEQVSRERVKLFSSGFHGTTKDR